MVPAGAGDFSNRSAGAERAKPSAEKIYFAPRRRRPEVGGLGYLDSLVLAIGNGPHMANRLVDKQTLYEGRRIRLEVHHFDDDATGVRTRRDVVVHPGAVVIMGFLEDGRLLLIRNRRYSVDEQLIELPAGTLEKGEDPMNCAGRELLEETGYLAGRLKPLASFYASPGVLTEKMHLFAAYHLEHRGQDLDAGEEIQVLPTAFADAVEMIRTGEIHDAKTIAAILMYERFHAAGR